MINDIFDNTQNTFFHGGCSAPVKKQNDLETPDAFYSSEYLAYKDILRDLKDAYDTLWQEMDDTAEYCALRFNMAKTIAEIRANLIFNIMYT
ncbi:MAG: hypothetical protein ACTSWN_06840 [Promethearchaeota archaeon]